MERDLILDIERDMDGWVEFMVVGNEEEEELAQRRNELRQRVAKLKKYREWEKDKREMGFS